MSSPRRVPVGAVGTYIRYLRVAPANGKDTTLVTRSADVDTTRTASGCAEVANHAAGAASATTAATTASARFAGIPTVEACSGGPVVRGETGTTQPNGRHP